MQKQLTVNTLHSHLLKKTFYYLHYLHLILICWSMRFDSRNTYHVTGVTGYGFNWEPCLCWLTHKRNKYHSPCEGSTCWKCRYFMCNTVLHPGYFSCTDLGKSFSTMKLLVTGIIPFSTSSFELPTTRFCLKEMTVLTSGKALKTSSLNCCSKVVSVCSWSTAVPFLKARHSAVFCALSRITTSKDRVVCFTRELACWREGNMIITCVSLQKTDQCHTNYCRSGGKAMNTQIQIAFTILAKKGYLILS